MHNHKTTSAGPTGLHSAASVGWSPSSSPPLSPSPPASPSKPASPGPKAVGKAPIAPEDDEPGTGAGLPLPHERDESTGDIATRPDPVIEQAAKDIASGQVDTDMRSTGGQTESRREQLLRRERH